MSHVHRFPQKKIVVLELMIGDVQLLPLLGMLNLLGWAFGYHVQDFLVNVTQFNKNNGSMLEFGDHLAYRSYIQVRFMQKLCKLPAIQLYSSFLARLLKRKNTAHSKLCFGAWGRTHLNHFKPPKTSAFWKGLPAQTTSTMFCLDHPCVLGWIWRTSYQYIGSGQKHEFSQ